MLNEQVGDDGDTEQHLYRVLTVPADHTDVSSSDDIQCELMTLRKWKGQQVYVPSGKTWVFKSNTLTSVKRSAYTIESGKMKNKKQLRISFDLPSYWDSLINVSDTHPHSHT